MTQKLLLKAGVHRRTWVSGSPLYVDVFISNETSKHIKKIELSLEKVVQFFSHQPVTTDVRAGEHLRMPEKTSKLVVARQITKASSRLGHRAWMGTPVQSEDESTCMLHIPSGLVTVDTGTSNSAFRLTIGQIMHATALLSSPTAYITYLHTYGILHQRYDGCMLLICTRSLL
jgi:hypothetical protein